MVSYDDGGNFNWYMSVAANNLAFVDSSWKEMQRDDYSKEEINRVYSHSNSNYDLLSTINYPMLKLSDLDINNEKQNKEYNNYTTLKLTTKTIYQVLLNIVLIQIYYFIKKNTKSGIKFYKFKRINIS